jgi:hypothetical protein
MSSSLIFQKQSYPRQILESLLVSLSLTAPLEYKQVKNMISGFVFNERYYINNQKNRGWLTKQDKTLVLTPRAKRRANFIAELITNPRARGGQIEHEIILIRSLFMCLLHLNLEQVLGIKKQKRHDSHYVHDLIIITRTDTLYLEIDTGSEPIRTLEDKIKGMKALNLDGTLIYFTSSPRTYSYLIHNPDVQIIYLNSPTLKKDILQLTSQTSVILKNQVAATNSYPDVEQSGQNVFLNNSLLYYDKQDNLSSLPNNESQTWEDRRFEVIKLLLEDDEKE